MTDGTTPLAVELKVARGGQGRYYRRALYQTALYRHFILTCPDLDPWFAAAGLDRAATRALVGIPTPTLWTHGFRRTLRLLEEVAAHLELTVTVVDDRATPELDT